jgi:hypothetical protein
MNVSRLFEIVRIYTAHLYTSVEKIDTSTNLEIASCGLIEGFEIRIGPKEFLWVG